MKKLLPRSCRRAIAISLAVFSALPVFGRMIDPRGYSFEASCITVGLFDTDSGVKRCEHGARSAECLQRAA